jgi:protein involved in plasmid replication-relaxation
MDALTPHKKSRNSRWSRDPVRDAGAPAVARITERDVEIFKLLARYRYLGVDDIQALVGGKLKPIVHRLNVLSRKPNLYINRPHQQRQSADANYRRLVYELDEHGSRVLRDRGFPFFPKSYHRNFAHELMVCRITASIEIGVRADSSIRLITWQEILASAKTPLETRRAERPAYIPISFAANGENHKTEVCADGAPFGLETTRAGKRTYLFFPGIEADCGTEPITTSDFERASISKKLCAYLAIAEQGVHRSHFGFPNFFVPFITTTRARMESMMALLDRLTGGHGAKMFLFKTFPSFTSFEKPPAATGHMLTLPWQRVGHPEFHLNQ